jgi:tetratricopeptide (TPR) repeat protein
MIKAKNNNTYNLARIAAFFVTAFAFLIFGTAFFPTGWNWGFHFLAFYNIEIIILVPFLMMLFTIPAVQDFFIDRLSLCNFWFNKKPRALQIVLTVAAFSGIFLLFWLFRVRSYFLGDGQIVLRNIQSVASTDQLAFAFKREPLTGLCIVILSNLFIFFKRSNPLLDAYCWLSIISGIIFVIIAWRFVKQYAEERTEQCMLFILLITTGISQLFFGYVENYSPSAAGILLFLFYGALYLKERISISWVIFIYGITLIFHLGILIFLPAIAFLIYFAIKRKQRKEIIVSLLLTALIIFSLLQLSLYPLELLNDVLSGTGRHFVPISSPLNIYQAYRFISLDHAVDVFNFLVLSYPAISILLIISGIIIWRNHKALTIETRFLLLTALCSFMFIAILNCEIGMSRDWDILAPISLGIPAATIALWNMIEYEKKFKHRILMMLCIVSPLHTGLWVGVNADEIKSEERFEFLNDDRLWSKHAHLCAYEELAVYHRDRDDFEDAIQYYQKYITLDSTNKRLYGNLAEAFQLAGNKKKAIEVYETMVNLGMDNYKIITNLGMLLADEQRYIEAMTLFRRAEAEAPEESIVKYCLGQTILISEHSHKKALPYFLDAIHFNPVFSQAYNAAAECYLQLGDSVRAEQLISKLQNLSGNSNIK